MRKRGDPVSKFLLHRMDSGYKFDLYAANGQSIASSEVYNTRSACHKGIDSVQKTAPTAPVEDLTEPGQTFPNPKFQLYQDKSGLFRFRLKARNGKIIAVSEAYQTKSGCENGIRSVRENAPDAQLEEE